LVPFGIAIAACNYLWEFAFAECSPKPPQWAYFVLFAAYLIYLATLILSARMFIQKTKTIRIAITLFLGFILSGSGYLLCVELFKHCYVVPI